VGVVEVEVVVVVFEFSVVSCCVWSKSLLLSLLSIIFDIVQNIYRTIVYRKRMMKIRRFLVFNDK
jgi:hypothetical protein